MVGEMFRLLTDAAVDTAGKKQEEEIETIKGRTLFIYTDGLNEADENHYANNFLTIAPRHIMAVAGQSTECRNVSAMLA